MEFYTNPTTSLTACSVGILTETECHKTSYTKVKVLNYNHNLCDSERELVLLRTTAFKKSKINEDLLIDVCEHHRILFLRKYEIYQKKVQIHFRNTKKA